MGPPAKQSGVIIEGDGFPHPMATRLFEEHNKRMNESLKEALNYMRMSNLGIGFLVMPRNKGAPLSKELSDVVDSVLADLHIIMPDQPIPITRRRD